MTVYNSSNGFTILKKLIESDEQLFLKYMKEINNFNFILNLTVPQVDALIHMSRKSKSTYKSRFLGALQLALKEYKDNQENREDSRVMLEKLNTLGASLQKNKLSKTEYVLDDHNSLGKYVEFRESLKNKFHNFFPAKADDIKSSIELNISKLIGFSSNIVTPKIDEGVMPLYMPKIDFKEVIPLKYESLIPEAEWKSTELETKYGYEIIQLINTDTNVSKLICKIDDEKGIRVYKDETFGEYYFEANTGETDWLVNYGWDEPEIFMYDGFEIEATLNSITGEDRWFYNVNSKKCLQLHADENNNLCYYTKSGKSVLLTDLPDL